MTEIATTNSPSRRNPRWGDLFVPDCAQDVLTHDWSCLECDEKIPASEYPYVVLAEKGTPQCSTCDEDMVLKERGRLIKVPYRGAYLDISSIHVTQRDMWIMSQDTHAGKEPCPQDLPELDWVVYPYDEGLFVWVPDAEPQDEKIEALPLSDQCKAIMKFASRLPRLHFVKFDVEGIVYQELEQYDW